MNNSNPKKQYSKEKLQQLKTNVKLEEVVEKDFFLEKFGKNYFTACPFCGAKKALSISIQKQFGHCFSCNGHLMYLDTIKR